MADMTPLLSHETKYQHRKNLANQEQLNEGIEDVTIIWFDQYMDDTKDLKNHQDAEKTKTLLREINGYVLFFSQPDPCIEYVKSVAKEKIFLIATGSYATAYLTKIHHLQQIDSVFIFCYCRSKYLPLKEQYSKIVDVYTEHKDLMESLRNNIDLVTKQATVFSLFDGKQRSTRYLTRESASFLWFQLLTEVLKTIAIADTKNTGIDEMLTHCQCYYRGNRLELNNIDEFRKKYKPEDAIVWYSKQSFVYRLVNRALRTEDIDALYTFRVYITHLRAQIADEHEQLRRISCNGKSNIIRLYRGLKMTKGEINQMVDNVGGIVSMNGFFSTSRDVEQAVQFALKKSQRNDVFGVLLEVEGNINLDKMIFADIAQFSAYPKEQEVLFDLATIFKIVHVEFDKVRNLWVIQLSGVEKSSYTVCEYIKSVGKESEEANPTLLLSRLMCDMGEYGKSEKYLKRLLSSLPTDHPDVSKIYFHLGRVSYLRGEHAEALLYYDQAIDLQKREVAPQEHSFEIARTLHNIANIYLAQRQTPKALEYYEKALEMKRLVLSENPDHPSIATTIAAIGSVYRRRGDLKTALALAEKSYQMKKLSLVNDHPSLADSLNSLGIIYQEMDDYKKALDSFQKALQIKQKTLPPTHPSISETLNNMGIVYRQVGDYNKALIYYKQALQIEKATLSADNLDLADTYNNLCTLYYDKLEYDKALEMAKCKLNILKKHYQDDDEHVKAAEYLIEEILDEINDSSHIKTNQTYSLEISF